MPKHPLFTVRNPSDAPRWIVYGPNRREPIDAGRSKELPISEETALHFVADGFEVTGPDGERVEAKAGKAKKAPVEA